MMELVTNSRKVLIVLSARHLLSLVKTVPDGISAYMLQCILCQMVEQLGVVIHGSPTLL
jgi:hypothetical protein